MTKEVSFRKLENKLLLSERIVGAESPLSSWYEKVCDKPLGDLTDGDLSVACRQKLFPINVVPLVLERLRSTPLAGEMYDGELLVSLSQIPAHYWENHIHETNSLKAIISNISMCEDEDVKSAILSLSEVVKTALKD